MRITCKGSVVIILFVTLTTSLGFCQDSLIAQQRMMVSKLSGASALNDNVTIKGRWTKREKSLSRSYLSSMLGSIGLLPREQNYKVNLPHKNRSQNPFTGTNSFAIVPSTIQTDEYIILGAHYDSVDDSPGAMDNATGCALVYGVANLIRKLEYRNRNVVVVFFDQEEVGHAGSFAFADYCKQNGWIVHSVHTADMIGWDSDGDRNIELELPTPHLEAVYKKHATEYGITAYTTSTAETDHREFRNAGFNAIGIGGEYKHGDTSPHHHKSTDTIETIDFEYLAFVTRLVYGVVSDLMTE